MKRDRATGVGRDRDGQPTSARVYAWVRRIVMMLAVICAALLIRRYDFERLRPQAEPWVQGVIRPGAMVVFTAAGRDVPVEQGALVEARVSIETAEGPRQGIVIGRVAAGPGAMLSVRGDELGAVLLVNGESTGRRFGGDAADLPFLLGVVPEDRYLLLRPSVVGKGYDALDFGLLPGEALGRKLITFF